MKHISVAIDFSKSADRALAYAEEIAIVFSAKITLIHVHPRDNGDDSAEDDNNLRLYSEASAKLAALGASVSQRGIPTLVSAYRGEVVPTLKKIINEGDCDLVVMGCQGENFAPNNPWGSTTTSLMDDTRTPILAVPDYAPVKYPRRFLLATDKQCPADLRQLAPLLKLLATDRTQLMLFHFQQATEEATPHRAYARLLNSVKHQFYYQADNHQPISDAVVSFADLTAADMLVVTHRDNHWLSANAKHSVANRVTMATTIPVLILQDSF
ncbi:universal stress protein [Neolewinella aurantiaca]|uniref:Universal stress protein n=1 Tax=Neolewinella aurantiaca TaxID=2602767 RepID=A0A5C7FK25_9BACT|nr:universal stress protein [Neolewinella aurantiaca]TXF90263.1 universal stress protein [Neolewinella aurantiaca]